MWLFIVMATFALIGLLLAARDLAKQDDDWVFPMGAIITFHVVICLGLYHNITQVKELTKEIKEKDPARYRMIITTDTTYQKI